MKLHSLKKITSRRIKRLGQGYGSGKGGHTSSRGQKGQKARGKIPAHFVGTSWVWFKRLPFIRGKSRFVRFGDVYTITLSDLNKFDKGAIVNRENLLKYGLVGKNLSAKDVIKLVASGKLEKSLKVAIPASHKAAEAVVKAGGEYRVQNN